MPQSPTVTAETKPTSARGINDAVQPLALPPGLVPFALNLTASGETSARREGRTLKFFRASSPVHSVHQITFADGDNRVIATMGSKTYDMAEFQFEPVEIPDCQLWLRTDSGVIIDPAGSGDDVGQWDDLSDSQFSFTQPTAANQPVTILASQNGRTAVRFDGVNDDMSAGSVLDLQGKAGLTIIMAIKLSAAFATDGVVIARDSAGNRGFKVFFSPADGAVYFELARTATTTVSRGGTTNSIGIARVISCVYDGGALTMNVFVNKVNDNGVLSGTIPATIGNNGSALLLGNEGFGNEYTGDIFEVALYNRALTTAERNQVEDYMKTRYAI